MKKIVKRSSVINYQVKVFEKNLLLSFIMALKNDLRKNIIKNTISFIKCVAFGCVPFNDLRVDS